jgi:hypothetical protein
VIVGSGYYFSASGPVPLSRELDPLFRSEVREPPIRNRRREPRGRIEHLAGLGWAIWRIKVGTLARCLAGMRAPGRPGEPQSTGGEQRRYCHEQMFSFHCFLFFDSIFTSSFRPIISECDRNVTKPDQIRDENVGKRDEAPSVIAVRPDYGHGQLPPHGTEDGVAEGIEEASKSQGLA